MAVSTIVVDNSAVAAAAAATVATPLTKAPSSTEDVVLAAVRFRREEVAGCFPFFFGASTSIPVATRPDLVRVLCMMVRSATGGMRQSTG